MTSMRISGLGVHFGGVRAVDDVSLEIEGGQVLGLIGPNGAGKTTLINAITGFQRCTLGSVFDGGREVTRWKPEQLARAGIARTFQGVRTFRGLSVLENVQLGAVAAGLRKRPARSRAEELLQRLGLAALANEPAGELAQGDERLVGISRAIAMSPRFLLLDEPAAGLNQSEAAQVAGLLDWIRKELHCGVLVVEHNVGFIMGLCDRVHVMSSGRTVTEGPPATVREDKRVIAAYLGGASAQARAGGVPGTQTGGVPGTQTGSAPGTQTGGSTHAQAKAV
ncbi:MAG TPA: ABC transporter ATP-binding protein [Solirubrobacteraceae bacterium]|jgi:branched-chain amino acid transport system ATP-binding protein